MKPTALIAVCALIAACAPSASDASEDAAAEGVAVETETRGYDSARVEGGSVSLRADIYSPIGLSPKGGVVLAHGGAFVGGSHALVENRSYGEALARRGYVVMSISYRLLDDAPVVGGWAARYAQAIRRADDPLVAQALDEFGPGWPKAAAAAARDLETAHGWLRQRADYYGFPSENIAYFGASAGALTAVTVAYHRDAYGASSAPRPAAVISMRGGAMPVARPAARLAPGDPPLMMVHGEDDERLPLAHAEALYAEAIEAGVPVSLQAAPGFGHELGGETALSLTDRAGRSVVERMDAFLAAAFNDVEPVAGGAERRRVSR